MDVGIPGSLACTRDARLRAECLLRHIHTGVGWKFEAHAKHFENKRCGG